MQRLLVLSIEQPQVLTGGNERITPVRGREKMVNVAASTALLNLLYRFTRLPIKEKQVARLRHTDNILAADHQAKQG